MSTYLTNDRESALTSGYIAARLTPEVNVFMSDMTYDDMKKSLSEWEIKGVARDGKTIGMAISKDGECHFCIDPEYQGRWLTKSLLKEINDNVDCRFTTVKISNTVKQRFVERMGFNQTGVSGDNIVYRLEELKYGH